MIIIKKSYLCRIIVLKAHVCQNLFSDYGHPTRIYIVIYND